MKINTTDWFVIETSDAEHWFVKALSLADAIERFSTRVQLHGDVGDVDEVYAAFPLHAWSEVHDVIGANELQYSLGLRREDACVLGEIVFGAQLPTSAK